ncbi:hypothetical protein [Tomitella fengzijianii]|uniref:Helix-turn-helix domain-containing protein n=1 Tax=Tomitella fengzijianii TaxID=2597660 RepID=A0A516X0T6_9ACTN|nr:hypothetical protein [Tomitella fengzijianii]QDQ96706.1 hypothetical protein FO059_04315 [Tomitella fengzijianii]
MIPVWAVTLTYDTSPTPETLDAWEDALAGIDAHVSAAAGRTQVVAHIDTLDAPSAIEDALAHTTKVVKIDAVGIETLRDDLYEQAALAPTLPELMSAPEVGDLLGVSRQRVHQLRHTAHFPLPLVELRTGPIWDAAAIRKFAADWDRKPGRPARRAS